MLPAAPPGEGSPRLVAVACSGGRDSTALLHATARAARELDGHVEVLALHVHHGLSPHADAWLRHVEGLCDAWRVAGLPVRLMVARLKLDPQPGDSVEAVAREARYAALADMAHAQGAGIVLLAHHRRDQAETLLLQALRGGGLRGLAAMPKTAHRDGVLWVRPWLDHPREAIEAYIARHGLTHIEDESNTDDRFARNRLRLAVWPALRDAFPDAEARLAASAARLQEALPALDRYEASLLQGLEAARGEGEIGRLPQAVKSAHPADELDAVRWAELGPADRRIGLSAWYRLTAGRALPRAWVSRLADEVPRLLAKQRAVCWREIGLSLYRGKLQWAMPSEAARAPAPCVLSLTAPGDYPVPAWRGVLQVREWPFNGKHAGAQGGEERDAVQPAGAAPARLRQVTLRAREGGERFQAGPGRPARSLKRQFQAAGVPAWQRQAPLVWDEAGALIFVPGLGLDARCLARPGEPQWWLTWVADTGHDEAQR